MWGLKLDWLDLVQCRRNPASPLLEIRTLFTNPCGDLFPNLEMLHLRISFKKLCRQFGTGQRHSVLRKREFTSVSPPNPSNPLWGDFGFFTSQLEVLVVCLKQQRSEHTASLS